MNATDEIAYVTELPDCDIHLIVFETPGIPANYDAQLAAGNGAWAYMCRTCWPKWSTGHLGLGLGQRLEVS